MISYLKGNYQGREQDGAVIEVGGIGFFVSMSQHSLEQMPAVGNEVKVYTYLHVKEDILALFGFAFREEMELFSLLIKVNGIGPKGALAVLSGMTVNELRFAVAAGDSKTIAKKSSGIGLKTAQKMILELKDKINVEDLEQGGDAVDTEASAMAEDAKREAVLALVSLGYSNSDALHTIKNIANADSLSVEQILKEALKAM